MQSQTIRQMFGATLVMLAAAGTACNKSEGEPQAESKNETSDVVQATHNAKLDTPHQDKQSEIAPHETPAPAATTPAEAVTNFLEAVRRGDDGQAEALLTELARKKTREMDLAVAPPGSPTAKFKIGDTEFPYEGAESAHVASSWSDVDGSGYERTDEIVWILRKEHNAWRIAGMATKLFDDQPPLILNFEDPQDMVSKQRAAEDEIRRRQETEATAAESQPLRR